MKKITAYRCYQINGYYETISLWPVNNGIAPDKIALELPDEFELCRGEDENSTPWIEHKETRAICSFCQREPGVAPMIQWYARDNGKPKMMHKTLRVVGI